MPIGSYIYLTNESYQKKGNKNFSPNKLLDEQRKKITNSITMSANLQGQCKELENFLNSLLFSGASSASFGGTNVLLSQVRQEVEKLFSEKYGNAALINWSTGGLNKNSQGIGIAKIADIDSERVLRKSTVEKRIRALESAIDEVSPSKAATITNQLVNIKAQLRALEVEAANLVSALEADPNIDFAMLSKPIQKALKSVTSFSRSNTEVQTLIQDLNNLSAAVGAVPNTAIGDILEMSLAVISEILQKRPLQEIQKAINSSMVGAMRGTPGFKMSNFDKNIDLLKIAGPRGKIKNGMVTYTNMGTQDKVDVAFSLGNGEGLRVSAKNYNLKVSTKEIHILSGSSLLLLLQNTGEFVDSFINASIYRIQSVSDNSTIAPNSSILFEYKKVLNELLLFEALTGANITKLYDGIGANMLTADTFIINDNSRSDGGIKVLPMQILYENILIASKENENLLKITETPALSSMKPWNGVPYQRFDHPDKWSRNTEILAHLHAVKISVAFSSKILDRI